jgi:hypothetical protein
MCHCTRVGARCSYDQIDVVRGVHRPRVAEHGTGVAGVTRLAHEDSLTGPEVPAIAGSRALQMTFLGNWNQSTNPLTTPSAG